MSIVLGILGIIAALIILVFIIAIFVKCDYSVQREVSINRDVTAVYDYVKYLKNQDNYSKWVMMDPNMQKDYYGTDGTIGFRSAWDSKDKNVGKGEQEITGLTENQTVDTRIHFIKPFEGFANAQMSTISTDPNQTLVRWAFDSKMKYPMNFMLLFLNMEKMVGGDLQIGLNNLKNVLENQTNESN
ncbi:SRPBCC family protein [Mucilaginibacter ginkgonis]|uniref:SRPBCC family protein n=1 Tax=Mucilaginibacter ginkgonis TaxID=2682091 RepID=A0A6I4I797_9SPHI|nr:SRPBCC family protein [Mucilaginibacter ginkgonis]QQL49176.1 SRPBCC family protein [Mucilaginibacter ginkgonis]